MTEYNWHEDFFKRKVFPQVCKDAGECSGFYAWLEVSEKQLYDEIFRLEQEIDAIWIAQGDRERFRTACRDWYSSFMAGIEKWKVAMKQETEARSQKPVEPEQIKMAMR